VAARLRAHPNTARFHLEALCEAGLVERQREARTVPGRPRTTYVAAAAAPPTTQRSYRLLAEILASQVAAGAPDPAEAAAEAGRRFGRLAVRGEERAETPAAAAAVVADTLSEMGFDSRPAEAGGAGMRDRASQAGETSLADEVRIDVLSCPFLEVATGHLEVVCSVHRGLMEGLLEKMGSPVRVASLEPLVGPSHCIARLRHHSGGGPGRARRVAAR
jgi:predicted ArsR family transcriptional regulator